MKRNLADFTPTLPQSMRRGLLFKSVSFLIMNIASRSFFFPNIIRLFLLKLAGVQLELNCRVKSRLVFWLPWNIWIGENTWIGEGVHLVAMERITIGANVCISQEAMLCAGSHDFNSSSFDYKNKPIIVEDGAWIGARALILPGVRIGKNSVIAAGEIVRTNIEPNTIRMNGKSTLIRES
jgi:putative colanic acid biosynthesis acetyltransferase WcaF